MNTTLSGLRKDNSPSRLMTGLLVVLLMAGTIPGVSSATTVKFYQRVNLVSDVPGKAKNTDSLLVGAWGVARSATSPWWVNSTNGGVSLVFDGTGTPFPLVVTIPPPPGQTGASTPTGIIFNSSGFELSPGNPAHFIFASLGGTISGWNAAVDPTNAVTKVDNSATAAYTGATIAPLNGENLLYAANFRGGAIDVFDTNYGPVPLGSNAFKDAKIPKAYAPFNVQWVNGALYVTYARKDVFQKNGAPGQGYVDVFDTGGTLIMRLQRGSWMLAPWGVALAPNNFGKFSNRILIGMFGAGRIAAFDAKKGKFLGFLSGASGAPVTIAKGLWGLGFGNGNGNSGAANALYFASDFLFKGKLHGLFGTLTPAQKTVQPSPPPSSGGY